MARIIARARAMAIMAGLAGFSAAISACSAIGALGGTAAAPRQPGPSRYASGQAAVSEPTVPAGACEDGTSSSAASYATRFQGQLAAAVADWAPTSPSGPSALAGGVPGQPGLHFVLRPVTTTSNSTGVPSIDTTIPALSPLSAEPAASDPNYNHDLRAWLAAKPGWQRQAGQAAAQGRALAARVRRYQVPRNTWSAVYSCLSGTVAQLAAPSGGVVRLVELSDWENNEPAVGLRLAGARVLMVEICPADAADGCPQRFAAAHAFLLRHGADEVEQIAADAVTPQALVSFWRS
jgi:hypothetical protein